MIKMVVMGSVSGVFPPRTPCIFTWGFNSSRASLLEFFMIPRIIESKGFAAYKGLRHDVVKVRADLGMVEVMDARKQLEGCLWHYLMSSRVNKLEKKKKSRTPQLKRRLFKVGIESSTEKSLEDVETQGRYGYGINITTAEPVTTASAPITTAGVSVSTAEPRTPPTTTTILIENEYLTIVQTLMKMRSVKLREKLKEKSKEKGVSSETVIRPTRGVFMKEASETITRPIVPPQQQLDPNYKGKGIMQEPKKLVKVKGKDQIAFDEEVAQRLEA
ncbi:hypothetical protein Tco_0755358 [Tanacetum coccineum]